MKPQKLAMPATESQLEELQKQAAKKCQGLPICYNFKHPRANTPSWYRISDFKEAELWQQVATTVTTVAGVLAWSGMIVRCFKIISTADRLEPPRPFTWL
eukprot:g5074.t1